MWDDCHRRTAEPAADSALLSRDDALDDLRQSDTGTFYVARIVRHTIPSTPFVLHYRRYAVERFVIANAPLNNIHSQYVRGLLLHAAASEKATA